MKTQSIFSRGRLSAGVAPVVLGLAMISMPAFAQTAPAAEDEVAAEGETIVVTGTLISNPNLKAASPVSVITSEEVELRQTNVAEEFLRQLPSSVPSIGSAVNNGNGGASTVNLRGIGSNRNLVLLDGQRIVPANLAGVVDLNNIPLALIERTDILTGGATTTYGADAVSGVVNFITKRDFSGIEATLSEQITEKGDGNVFRADVTIGANFDDGRGNAVFSVGYQEADPVFQGDRAFSVNNIDSFSGNPGGSGTAVPARITGTRGLDAAGNPNTIATLMQIGVNAAGVPILAPRPGGAANGGTRQIDPATGRAITPFTTFNFNPFNIFQTPFERFNIFGQARYEISDRVEVYTQGLFSKNTVSTIIAPSGSFGSTLTLPLSNPFLPAATRNQLCAFNVAPNVVGVDAAGNPLSGQIAFTPRFTQAQCDAAATAQPGSAAFQTVTVSAPRRFVEAGTRNSDFTTTIFNYGLGFRGDLTDNIRYDVYGSYGESENVQRQSGNGLLSRLRQAVLATNVNGVPTCTVATGGCVPINLFGPEGSITAAQLGFLTGPTTSSTTQTSLSTVKGVISGDTGSFAIAETPIGFAVGVEYRKYSASSISDLATQTPGEVLGNGAASPDVFGEYDVKEAFGELIIPLLEDKSFAKNLTVELGGRYSDYSTAGKSYTYKAGGSYEPIEGLKIRGNYQRGARAPNIGELFSPQVTGLINLANDPCAGAAPTTNNNLRAICLAQGAPVGTIGSINQPSAGQANQTSGGNPNLDVEKTKTYTVGAVWQPSFVPKLSISVDYFNIKVRGAVSAPTAGDVINACFGNITAASAASSACTSIRRNPLTGGLDGDTATTPGLPLAITNLGRIKTDGIDLSINYSRDLGFATYSTSFDGTFTNSNKFQASPSAVNRECVSFISSNCGSLQPEFAWTQRTSLTFEDRYTISLLWRHLSKFEQEPLDLDPVNGNGPFCGPGNQAGGCAGRNFQKINAKDYYDLSGRFELSDNVVLTVTVQNLLDSKPKVVGSNAGTTAFNSGNVFPSTFDSLGRRYAAAVKFKF
jgi:outer membrane receptor protein involved in Fe transport